MKKIYTALSPTSLLFFFSFFLLANSYAQQANVSISVYNKNSASFETGGSDAEEHGQNEWSSKLNFKLSSDATTYGTCRTADVNLAHVGYDDDVKSYDMNGVQSLGTYNACPAPTPQYGTTYNSMFSTGNLRDSLDTNYKDVSALYITETMDAWEDDNWGSDCNVGDLLSWVWDALTGLFGGGGNFDASGVCADLVIGTGCAPHNDRCEYYGNTNLLFYDVCFFNLIPWEFEIDAVGGDDAHCYINEDFSFRNYAPPGFAVDNVMGNQYHMGTIHHEWIYYGTASPLPTIYCASSNDLTFPTSAAGDIFSYSVPLEAGRTYTFSTDNGLTVENTYLRLYGSDGKTIVQEADFDAVLNNGSQKAAISYTPSSTGYYYLEVSAGTPSPEQLYYNSSTGIYSRVNPASYSPDAFGTRGTLYPLKRGLLQLGGRINTADISPAPTATISPDPATIYNTCVGSTVNFVITPNAGSTHFDKFQYKWGVGGTWTDGLPDGSNLTTLSQSWTAALGPGSASELYVKGLVSGGNCNDETLILHIHIGTTVSTGTLSSNGQNTTPFTSVCATSNVAYTASGGTGTPSLQYQWNYATNLTTSANTDTHGSPTWNTLNATPFTWVASTTTPAYVAGGTDPYRFYVRAVYDNGTGCPAYSNVVYNDITSNPVGITLAASPTGVCPGGSSTITASATWYDPGTSTTKALSTSGWSYTYEWFKNGVSVKGPGSGVGADSYTYTNVQESSNGSGISFPVTCRLVITSVGICAAPTTQTTAPLTLNITSAYGGPTALSAANQCPSGSSLPVSVCSGGVNLTMQAVPAGAPPASFTGTSFSAYALGTTSITLKSPVGGVPTVGMVISGTGISANTSITAVSGSSPSYVLTISPATTGAMVTTANDLTFTNCRLEYSATVNAPNATSAMLTDPAVTWTNWDNTIAPNYTGPTAANPGYYNLIKSRWGGCTGGSCAVSAPSIVAQWLVVAAPAIAAGSSAFTPTVNIVCGTKTLTETAPPTGSGGYSSCSIVYQTNTDIGGGGTWTTWPGTPTTMPGYSINPTSGTTTTGIRAQYGNCTPSGSGCAFLGCNASAWLILHTWDVVPQPNPITSLTPNPAFANVCTQAILTIDATNYGASQGAGCPVEYSYNNTGDASTSNVLTGTWSTPSASVPSFNATTGVNGIRARLNCGGSPNANTGCNTTAWTGTFWTVGSTPTISAGTGHSPADGSTVCPNTPLSVTGISPTDLSCDEEYGYSFSSGATGPDVTIGSATSFTAVGATDHTTVLTNKLWAHRTNCTATNCPEGTWTAIGTWYVTPAPIGATITNYIDLGTMVGCDTKTHTTANNTLTNCFADDNSYSNHDVYYRFVMNEPATIRITTCGSNFDTHLTLLNGLGTVIATGVSSATCSGRDTMRFNITESVINAGGNNFYAVVEGEGSTDVGTISISVSIMRPNDPAYESPAQALSSGNPTTICPTTPTAFSVGIPPAGSVAPLRSGYNWTSSTGLADFQPSTYTGTTLTGTTYPAGTLNITLNTALTYTPTTTTTVTGTGITAGTVVSAYNSVTKVITLNAITTASISSNTTLTFTDSNIVAVTWNSYSHAGGTITVTPTTYGGTCAGYPMTVSPTITPSVEAVTLAQSAAACVGTSINITATALNSGVTSYWQGTSSTATSTTGGTLPYSLAVASGTNTYYARQYSASPACYGPAASITVTEIAKPATPTVSITGATDGSPILTGNACVPSTASVVINSNNSCSTCGMYWQSNVGGSSSATGTAGATGSYTGSVTSGGTYYFRSAATIYNGAASCWSDAGSLRIDQQPTAASSISGATTGCAPPGIPLSVVAGAGTNSYWQTSSSGTATTSAGLATTANTTGTYYSRRQNTTTGCWSDAASLAVTINPTPAAPTVTLAGTVAPAGLPAYCGTVDLTASSTTSTATIYWQNTNATGTSTGTGAASAGINFTQTATASSPTTYYFGAMENGCWSYSSGDQIAVATAPAALTGPTTACTNVPFTTTGTLAGSYLLYWQNTTAFGTCTTCGSAQGTSGATQFSSTVATAGDYFIRRKATSGNLCWSADLKITVSDPPANPTVTSISGTLATIGSPTYCGPVDLTASSTTNSATIYWQNTTSNGVSVGTGATTAGIPFTQQVASGSSTYYFGARSPAGCWSYTTGTPITINSLPATPTASTTPANGMNCSATGVTLTPANLAGVITYWQTSSSGTATIGVPTGTSTITATTGTAGTDYYARRLGTTGATNGCWSAAYGPVNVKVFGTPTPPTINITSGTGSTNFVAGFTGISSAAYAAGASSITLSSISGGTLAPGMAVSGTGIASGTTIGAGYSAGSLTIPLSANTVAPGVSLGGTIYFGITGNPSTTYNSGATSITLASPPSGTIAVGMSLGGPGIPNGAVITSVTSQTVFGCTALTGTITSSDWIIFNRNEYCGSVVLTALNTDATTGSNLYWQGGLQAGSVATNTTYPDGSTRKVGTTAGTYTLNTFVGISSAAYAAGVTSIVFSSFSGGGTPVVGMPITGSNIPSNTTISSFSAPYTVGLSNALTGAGVASGAQITLGSTTWGATTTGSNVNYGYYFRAMTDNNAVVSGAPQCWSNANPLFTPTQISVSAVPDAPTTLTPVPANGMNCDGTGVSLTASGGTLTTGTNIYWQTSSSGTLTGTTGVASYTTANITGTASTTGVDYYARRLGTATPTLGCWSSASPVQNVKVFKTPDQPTIALSGTETQGYNYMSSSATGTVASVTSSTVFVLTADPSPLPVAGTFVTGTHILASAGLVVSSYVSATKTLTLSGAASTTVAADVLNFTSSGTVSSITSTTVFVLNSNPSPLPVVGAFVTATNIPATSGILVKDYASGTKTLTLSAAPTIAVAVNDVLTFSHREYCGPVVLNVTNNDAATGSKLFWEGGTQAASTATNAYYADGTTSRSIGTASGTVSLGLVYGTAEVATAGTTIKLYALSGGTPAVGMYVNGSGITADATFVTAYNASTRTVTISPAHTGISVNAIITFGYQTWGHAGTTKGNYGYYTRAMTDYAATPYSISTAPQCWSTANPLLSPQQVKTQAVPPAPTLSASTTCNGSSANLYIANSAGFGSASATWYNTWRLWQDGSLITRDSSAGAAVGTIVATVTKATTASAIASPSASVGTIATKTNNTTFVLSADPVPTPLAGALVTGNHILASDAITVNSYATGSHILVLNTASATTVATDVLTFTFIPLINDPNPLPVFGASISGPGIAQGSYVTAYTSSSHVVAVTPSVITSTIPLSSTLTFTGTSGVTTKSITAPSQNYTRSRSTLLCQPATLTNPAGGCWSAAASLPITIGTGPSVPIVTPGKCVAQDASFNDYELVTLTQSNTPTSPPLIYTTTSPSAINAIYTLSTTSQILLVPASATTYDFKVADAGGCSATLSGYNFIAPYHPTDLVETVTPASQYALKADCYSPGLNKWVTYRNSTSGVTTGSTAISATSIVLTADPSPVPVAGQSISGQGILAGSTVGSYNTGTHTVTVAGTVVTAVIPTGTTVYFGKNEAIIAINDNGNDLGQVTVTLFKENAEPDVPLTGGCAGSSMKALKRHFLVVPSKQPASAVGVRIFLSPTELSELSTASLVSQGSSCNDVDNVNTISDLYVTKYNDAVTGTTSGSTAVAATSVVLSANPSPLPVAGAVISGVGIAPGSTITAYNSGTKTATVASTVVTSTISNNSTLYFSNKEDGDYSNNTTTTGYYKVYGTSAPNALTKSSGGFASMFTGTVTAHHYLELSASELSEFWIHGSTNNSALPVTMLYLEASAVNNAYIQVRWATASEINNDGFNVERSTDGVNWTQIGFVDGHDNSTVQNDYSYDDHQVSVGIRYYYRLKQVDNDGAFEYTDIVSAILTGELTFDVKNFVPNPAAGTTTLWVTTSKEQEITVAFYDVLGRKVYNGTHSLIKGDNKIPFDISRYAAGAYTAIVTSGNEIYTKKLVVNP